MIRLKELREEFNMKIRSFDEFGFSRNIINNLELGLIKVNNEKIATFCKLFDVSSDYFLGLSDEGIYVYYKETKYALNRDQFLDYSEYNYIKYEDMKRIIVLPDDKELVSKLPFIPLAVVVDKSN